MKDNWNPEDWQGRSMRKVEDNYKILDLTFKVIGILGAISLIIYLIF
jgi:hypothetical protein